MIYIAEYALIRFLLLNLRNLKDQSNHFHPKKLF